MKVTSVRIKNVLGVSEATLECGSITEIRGKNASSKTSILEAIKAGLQGGNLARLQKLGTEDEAEVVLVLDDGRYRVERKGEDADVKERVGQTAAYEKIRRPQSWLDSLFDPVMSNPLRFLTAHPNDRADLLLEVLPLQLDRQAFMAKLAVAWPDGKELIEGHPLEVLSFARTTLFDERTGVNRSQKDKASSAYELQKALPAEMPADPDAALQQAAAARDELFRKLAAKRAAAEVAEKRSLDEATAAYEAVADRVAGEFKTAAAKLRGELERKIAALKAETEAAIAAERRKGEDALAAADEAHAKVQETAAEARREAFAIADALQPDLQAAERRVAELAAQSKNVAQLQESKRLADKFEKEAEGLKEVSDRLTAAIVTVGAFKRQLVKDLPIEGLEIHGKQILVNGVPFDQMNTAARIKLSVQVATLRAKKQVLPVIFIDGAEALDREQYNLLVKELEASGCQAFIARVEEGDLAIDARDGAEHPSATKVVPMPQTAAGRRGRRVLAE
jgi:recombinational DNA repair ATPase RecF